MSHLDDVLNTIADHLDEGINKVVEHISQLEQEVRSGGPKPETVARLKDSAEALHGLVRKEVDEAHDELESETEESGEA